MFPHAALNLALSRDYRDESDSVPEADPFAEARARLALVSRDVGSVGLSVGYDSASQFSREYRRMFGASPGKDAERLRATSALRQAMI